MFVTNSPVQHLTILLLIDHKGEIALFWISFISIFVCKLLSPSFINKHVVGKIKIVKRFLF